MNPCQIRSLPTSWFAATTTKTGLTIQADHDPTEYPKGVKVSDAELAAIPLTRHDWHGDWNYTIRPT